MKTLESILSNDLDIKDYDIIPKEVLGETFGVVNIDDSHFNFQVKDDIAYVNLRYNFNCLSNLSNLFSYGIKQINITAEGDITVYSEHLNNVSINTGDTISIILGYKNHMDWDNVELCAQRGVEISTVHDTPILVKMRHTKIDSSLSISNASSMVIDSTSNFENVKFLNLDAVSGRLAKRLADLKYYIIPKIDPENPDDVSQFWDIDIWKALRLNPKKWPNLGGICITILGSNTSILLWNPGRGMIPAIKRIAPDVEYKDGWKGTIIGISGRTEIIKRWKI